MSFWVAVRFLREGRRVLGASGGAVKADSADREQMHSKRCCRAWPAAGQVNPPPKPHKMAQKVSHLFWNQPSATTSLTDAKLHKWGLGTQTNETCHCLQEAHRLVGGTLLSGISVTEGGRGSPEEGPLD